MTPHEILRYRLFSQKITRATCAAPGELVAALGAVQAQDYAGALWAIGLRLPQATQAVVENAIEKREIVRTWPLRGTLHFVAAADARWMLELVAPRTIAGSARRARRLELDDATFARSRKALERALRDGPLSREMVYRTLEGARISTAGQRGYHILWRLAQEGAICFAANQGKQPTFALLDEWLPRGQRMARDAALGELARRYVVGHGPATLKDFVWWSGLTTADARAGLEEAAGQLVSAKGNGVEYWLDAQAGAPPRSLPAACLLPGFDEYLLGYSDRSAVLDEAHAEKIVPGRNGMFMPTLVLKGRVAGTWKRTVKKDSVAMQAYPFTPFNKTAARAVSDAATRYGEFLGLPVAIARESGAR